MFSMKTLSLVHTLNFFYENVFLTKLKNNDNKIIKNNKKTKKKHIAQEHDTF